MRSYPCNDIAAPTNGAILCNNWRKDFGQFCIHLCQESYTVGRGINPNNIYVCGASGLWLPSSNSPDCNVIVSSLLSTDGYIIANSYKNCTMDIKTMQSFYITSLKESMFSYFCDKFPDECIEGNTDHSVRNMGYTMICISLLTACMMLQMSRCSSHKLIFSRAGYACYAPPHIHASPCHQHKLLVPPDIKSTIRSCQSHLCRLRRVQLYVVEAISVDFFSRYRLWQHYFL
ncbi:unnamed protein product [Mytilus coruscus]|uniref:Sushi domain-containing protein n=1 Tax=Mytilus coruscus TaxID=42192 RepID=A0A6J8B4Z8_MYTCO|nr:unnamed protein product [Mytilus coruscus]